MYWQGKAERADAKYNEYKLEQISLQKQARQGLQMAEKKIFEQELALAGSAVEDEVDLLLLVTRLRTQLKERDAQVRTFSSFPT